MVKFCYILFICAVLLSPIGCGKQPKAAPQKTPAGELMTLLPDDVLGFVATSGGENLKPAFEKSILGRIWNDPEVQTLYLTVKEQILAKVKQQVPDANEAEAPARVLDFVTSAVDRPIIIGAARKQADQGPPVYGFAILDAGEHKAEIAARLAKLEALADEGDITEVDIGSFKMHGPADNQDVPAYWGWVENYLLLAVNDGEGLAIKRLQQPRITAPDYLEKVPGTNDVLAVYVDSQKVADVVKAVAESEGAAEELAVAAAVIKKLGFANVATLTSRVGFDDTDLVCSELVEVPQPRTGLLAGSKPIDLKMLDMVDARAVRAAAINYDFAGAFDTIAEAVKIAAPNDLIEKIQEGIAGFESQVHLDLRKGLLESLAGSAVFYMLPGGVMMESPNGGAVVIARLKDGPSLEKTLVALGKFAAGMSKDMLKVSSQVQNDGRTFHSWVIAPLAMMQVMPCWMVVDDHIVIASNPALHKAAVAQMTSPKQSIRTTEGYKKATAKLPENLVFLSYTDSKVQFKQIMLSLQQFWPMITMFAAKAEIDLPAVLPSLEDVIEDVGPSCQYAWFDAEGLRTHYRGSGVEVSLGSVAGAGLGVGILMPALTRTRQISTRLQSGTNLSGIGKACLIYANDYDDKLPPNLEVLIEKAELSPKYLESPRKPKGFDGPSYIYIAGQTTANEPGNIVAYENPAFSSEGLNVLFMDCHVEWMKADDFLRDLDATYKRLGREIPEIKFNEPNRIVPVEELEPIPVPEEK